MEVENGLYDTPHYEDEVGIFDGLHKGKDRFLCKIVRKV